VSDSLNVPASFNGPLQSGNGGYAAGALAGLVGEPAEVSLRSPVPLEKELEIVREEDGSVRMLDGETLVCEGRALEELGAGKVEGRELVASAWTPPAWAAGDDGQVRRELVWGVLDCPTYFATHMEGELSAAMLGRMSAEIARPVEVGVEHVVIGWPIEIDGRKHHAGSALFTAEGELLAAARALMIEPRAA
jgi:hypothetical protein